MLRLAITFFIISIIAAFFGFSGVAAATSDISVFLFWLFLIMFLATLVFGLLSGKAPKV